MRTLLMVTKLEITRASNSRDTFEQIFVHLFYTMDDDLAIQKANRIFLNVSETGQTCGLQAHSCDAVIGKSKLPSNVLAQVWASHKTQCSHRLAGVEMGAAAREEEVRKREMANMANVLTLCWTYQKNISHFQVCKAVFLFHVYVFV